MHLLEEIINIIFSETIKQFNDLYNNHYEALDAFIRGYQPFNVIANSSDKSFFFDYQKTYGERCEKIQKEWYTYKRNISIRSMSFLVSEKSTIIKLYEVYIKHAKVHGQIRTLAEDYPHAFALFCHNLGVAINNMCNLPKFFSNKKCSISINDWSELSFEHRTEILKHKNDFAETENNLLEQIKLDNWITKQNEFGSKYRTLKDKIIEHWGCYSYDIRNKLFHDSFEPFRVWQFFPRSFCLARDIDYKESVNLKTYGEELFDKALYYRPKDWIKRDLSNFLDKIEEPYSIILCNLEDTLFNDYHEYDKHLNLSTNILSYYCSNENLPHCFCDNIKDNLDKLNQNIIIIDIITNNNKLKSIVYDIIEQTKHQCPNIIYVSIYKEYDRDEILEIIELKEKAKAITTDQRYKLGYEYYVSINDIKPIATCRIQDCKKIINSKTLFEEKTLELEESNNIKQMLSKAVSLAKASHIELARETIDKAEAAQKGLKLPEKEDAELKTLIEKTRNHLNIEYKESGFFEEWKELRVDYSVPQKYLQTENWIYAVSKFPEKGTILYPYRRRKTARTGHIEMYFLNQLRKYLPSQIKPIHDICINIADESRPYEPDIALFVKGCDTIRIDVEIDEPYAALTKEPIHYITCGDEYRDEVLNRHGWIVVRFAEKQIKKHPESCILYLVKLVNDLIPEIVIPQNLLNATPLPPMKRWTKNEAIKMAANGEREEYLKHKFTRTDERKIELSDIRLNENERKCQLLVKKATISKEMTEKILNFTDSGVYERDKYIDFTPYEHIYIHKGEKQLLPVSSLVAYFFEKFNALEQAEKKAKRCSAPAEYFLTQWDRLGKLASEVGTFVHLQTENYFKNKKFETEYQFEYEGIVETINVEKEKEHFLSFIKDFSIIPYRQEWPIYDTDLNIAGTIDLICKENDGEFSIYDWKRSKKIIDIFGNPIIIGFNNKMSFNGINVPDTSYYHYCIQQNLYRYMLEKNYGIKIKSMNLVVLCPEYPQYYKINVPFMDEVIDAIVNVCKEKNLGHRLLN